MPEFFNIADFSQGNNLLNDPRRIGDGQTLRTKNLVPYAKGVLEKRRGSSLYFDIGHSVTKINALRSIQIGADKYVIAVGNCADNDKIFYSKNGADFIEMTGTTSLTANQDYSIAVDHLGRIYIANGTDAIQISTTGETRADLTLIDQSRNGKYLHWWKDRLWIADVENNAVYYSENLVPGEFKAASVLYPGSKDSKNPIMGMIPLSMNSATEGIINVFLIFRKNGIWPVGWDTSISFLNQLSGIIGCWDDKSICATPMGVMFVGRDTAYHIPLSGEPESVGNLIKPVWDGSHPFRGRNTLVRSAAAIYFNGFVHIAYPEVESYNNRQYYLDLRDYSNTGWFGDHDGLNLACYAVDGITLYGGSSTDGKVLLLEQTHNQDITYIPNLNSTWHSDSRIGIEIELQTKVYSPDGSEFTTKIFKRFGFNLSAEVSTNFSISWAIDDRDAIGYGVDGDGARVGYTDYPLTVVSSLWDTAVWDVSKWWAGNIFQIIKGFFQPSDRGRFIGFVIKEKSSNIVAIQSGLLSFIKTGRIL